MPRKQEERESQERRWLAFLEWFFSLFMGLTTVLFGLLPILSDFSPALVLGATALVSFLVAWRWCGRAN